MISSQTIVNSHSLPKLPNTDSTPDPPHTEFIQSMMSISQWSDQLSQDAQLYFNPKFYQNMQLEERAECVEGESETKTKPKPKSSKKKKKTTSKPNIRIDHLRKQVLLISILDFLVSPLSHLSFFLNYSDSFYYIEFLLL